VKKLLAYPLSLIYVFVFTLTLLVFHPIQWVCYNVFGYAIHGKSVAIMNLCLMRCSHLLGGTYAFNAVEDVPTDRPLIIVSNHQSMHDISPIIWFMRKHHPKFVSKKELGWGYPSVSYNLRVGGSALIDRNDKKQSLQEIAKLGKYIEEHHRSAVIFPEGTRSRNNGRPKPFKPTGMKILMKNAPSALIVPISINNSWKMLRYGKFPVGIFSHITFDMHSPIAIEGDLDELIARTEAIVVAGVNSFE